MFWTIVFLFLLPLESRAQKKCSEPLLSSPSKSIDFDGERRVTLLKDVELLLDAPVKAPPPVPFEDMFSKELAKEASRQLAPSDQVPYRTPKVVEGLENGDVFENMFVITHQHEMTLQDRTSEILRNETFRETPRIVLASDIETVSSRQLLQQTTRVIPSVHGGIDTRVINFPLNAKTIHIAGGYSNLCLHRTIYQILRQFFPSNRDELAITVHLDLIYLGDRMDGGVYTYWDALNNNAGTSPYHALVIPLLADGKIGFKTSQQIFPLPAHRGHFSENRPEAEHLFRTILGELGSLPRDRIHRIPSYPGEPYIESKYVYNYQVGRRINKQITFRFSIP
jgi:hypothetical protein